MEGEEEGEDEEEDGEDLVSECYSVEKCNIHVYIDLCPEVTEVCLQKNVEDFEVNISKREMIFFLKKDGNKALYQTHTHLETYNDIRR